MLNGLTVIFVLELDNRIPQVFVPIEETDQIKDEFVELFRVERQRLKELRTRDSMSKETWQTVLKQYPQPRLVTIATSFVCFASLLVGFDRATGPLSNISCEMMVHYYFYRIGLQFGLWWSLFGQICGDLSSFAFDVARAVSTHYRAGQGSVVIRSILQAIYELAIWPFFGTLFAGFSLTAAYALVNLMYWPPITPLKLEMYFSGFFSDVFGLCAASGYADFYVLECITPSAG